MHLVNFAAEPPADWKRLYDLAIAADNAGIGRVFVSDHVAFGERLEDYGDPALGGIAGGRQPTGPDGLWLEPLTVLAMIGARTERVRLCTMVLLAALRRPAVLAKTAATIDVLTGGRLDLGVGVGWQRAEYEAAGLDFESRGRRLDHTLEVCEALWTHQSAAFADDELRFESVHQMPKPVSGTVPIWVSGTVNSAAMARLARFGTGWIPWGRDAADIVAGIAAMRRAVSDAGRDPDGIEVAGQLPIVRDSDGEAQMDATMRALPPLIEAGVTDFRAALAPPMPEADATEFLAAWCAAFAEATARG